MKRQRATVIVEIDGKILLVENRGGLLLLPGGGINADESHAQAAARELAEETGLFSDALQFLFSHESGLFSDALQFLFSHESQTNCHHVFRASASGAALAGDDAMALHLLGEHDRALVIRMSAATRLIIERFERTRENGQSPGDFLDGKIASAEFT